MVGASYSHGDQKVGSAFLETAYFGHENGGDIGHECLYDKDDGNDGEVRQLIGGQLRGELRKDWLFGKYGLQALS